MNTWVPEDDLGDWTPEELAAKDAGSKRDPLVRVSEVVEWLRKRAEDGAPDDREWEAWLGTSADEVERRFAPRRNQAQGESTP